MKLIEISVTVNEEALPEWLPPELVKRLVEEIGEDACTFADRVDKLRVKYEDEARSIAGENVVPFPDVGVTRAP